MTDVTLWSVGSGSSSVLTQSQPFSTLSFSPTDVAGCRLWLTGDDSTSSNAPDLSGMGHNFVGVAPPAISAAPNGHACMEFNGATYYRPSGWPNPQTSFFPWDVLDGSASSTFGWTIFVVFNMTSPAGSLTDHLAYMAAEYQSWNRLIAGYALTFRDYCLGIRLAAPHVIAQFGEVSSADPAIESTMYPVRFNGSTYEPTGAGDTQISVPVVAGDWDIVMIRFQQSGSPQYVPIMRSGRYPTEVSGPQEGFPHQTIPHFVVHNLVSADTSDGAFNLGYGCTSKVAEVICYNEDIGCDNRDLVGLYLAAKYGLPYELECPSAPVITAPTFALTI